MKQLFLLAVTYCCCIIVSAQVPQTGVLTYNTVYEYKTNIGGRPGPSQKMPMGIEITYSGDYYLVLASMGGQSVGNIQIAGGGMKMKRYYDPSDKSMYNVNIIGQDAYFVKKDDQPISNMKETGNTKEILGYPSHEFTCVYNGVTAKGWYSKLLPSHVSPEGNLGLPGGIVSLESEKVKIELTSAKLGTLVTEAETKIPAGSKKMTKEEFEAARNNF